MKKIWEGNPAIGIDLGTTYSVVGVWNPEHSRVEILENELGNPTTPSLVAFTKIKRLVGQPAKNQALLNPSNTIFESKRLIGRRFNDSTVQEDIQLWPFKIVRGEDERLMIEVTYGYEKRQFGAEEISSIILLKMKGVAEAKLGIPVKNAVITVPAHFNDAQRQATKDAGELVGLNVLGIINEPTAAAMAYGLHKNISDGTKNVLVFDLGGGTFDVCLASVAEDTFNVKAVTGDRHLGGGDFDNRMTSHFVAEFQRKHRKDISKNRKALGKLRDACEKAKRTLTCAMETSIEIDSLCEGIDFYSTISRARFESMNMDLFTKCIELVDKFLKDAKMRKSQVHDVVLVGGSARIPKIQSMLKDFFNGKELLKCINQDEAVAYGAALQAAILGGVLVVKDNNKNVVRMNVTPLSIGLEGYDGKMKVVIPRNTSYPTRVSYAARTTFDNQISAYFSVYEGEETVAEENNLLGSFKFEGIPQGPNGKEKFEVCFEIDYDGILTVSAQHVGTENKTEIRFANYIHRIKRDPQNAMAKLAEKKRSALIAKNNLEDYLFSKCSTLSDYIMILNGTTQWLKNSFDEASVYNQKLSELQTIFDPIPNLHL